VGISSSSHVLFSGFLNTLQTVRQSHQYATTSVYFLLSFKSRLAARLLATEWLFATSFKSTLNYIQLHALIAGTDEV